MASPSETKLKNAFNKIKAELSDHLQAINENTNELNANSEILQKYEAMIMKIGERLDNIEFKMSEISGEKKISKEAFKEIILSPREKEIFMMQYESNGNLLDFRKLASHLGLTEVNVRKNIESLIGKGIPIVKKYFDGKIYLVLDSDFRNLQAKENVLKIN